MSEIDVSRITGVSDWAYGNSRFDGIRTMANNAGIQANNAANAINSMVVGIQSIWIPASAFTGVEGTGEQAWGSQPTHNVTYGQYHTEYNTTYYTLDFSDSVSQYCAAHVSMPGGWTGGNLNFDLVTSTPANCVAGSNKGAWIIHTGLYGDQLNVDTFISSYNVATHAEFQPLYDERNILVYRRNITANLVPQSMGNTWTGNSEQVLIVRLTRYVDNAVDNVPNQLKFHGVVMYYPVSSKKNDNI